jgi:hypothetical protein
MTLIDSQLNPQDISQVEFQAKYQTLRDRLEAFKVELLQIQDLTSWQIGSENLERSQFNIQEFFQTKILGCLNSTSEDPNIPHYVEINKQLRLLEADLKLLKITRSPEILTKRINQARDRLGLLLTYCNSLLGN